MPFGDCCCKGLTNVSSAEHWLVRDITSLIAEFHTGGTGVGNLGGMLGNNMYDGVHARVGGSLVYPHRRC